MELPDFAKFCTEARRNASTLQNFTQALIADLDGVDTVSQYAWIVTNIAAVMCGKYFDIQQSMSVYGPRTFSVGKLSKQLFGQGWTDP